MRYHSGSWRGNRGGGAIVTWFHLFFNVVGTMAALPVLAAIFHLLPQAELRWAAPWGLQCSIRCSMHLTLQSSDHGFIRCNG